MKTQFKRVTEKQRSKYILKENYNDAIWLKTHANITSF